MAAILISHWKGPGKARKNTCRTPVGDLSETRLGRPSPLPMGPQAKRKRAWKSPHARKARRGGEREKWYLSPQPRLAFLAWGDFHARLRFTWSTIPEEKWGLLVVYRWGKMPVWQSRYLCLLNTQILVIFFIHFSFFSGANPYITENP